MANPRVKDLYLNTIVAELKDKFQYKSVMQVPKLTKIVINKGIGAAVSDKNLLVKGVELLSIITDHKAVPTNAKVSISNFKLRECMPIGYKITFRGDRMYEFLDRLITVALPRVRDYRGVNDKGFDGRGNYTLGISEQIIFPEISIEKINKISGMDITLVTTAKTDEEAYAMFKA